MIKIKQAIVVEGKYDKIKISSIFDATIIQTNGFQIFKEKEKLNLLRILSEKTGLIILTDSDTAGFQIRRYIGGATQKNNIINVYIPDVFGKEKRKVKPSAQGKIGVEGIEKQLIIEAFEKAGILYQENNVERKEITKLHFFEDGLTGGENSVKKRAKLLKELNLPQLLTTNSMLSILNTLLDYDEYKEIIENL